MYEIVYDADDFCKSLEKWLAETGLRRNGKTENFPVNAMAHITGGVIAYAYYDEKP